MSRIFPLLIVLAIFTTTNAQTITPATSTLRTGVQLVVVDVVVTDKSGQPVRGLKLEDFTLSDNKSAQSIKTFEEHATPAIANNQSSLPASTGVFRNTPQVHAGAVDVLLLDALNTPPDAQPYLRNQLVKFLAAQTPGRQFAIFTLNTRLAMLQTFTADPAILKLAVKQQGVKFSPLLNRELNDSAAHRESELLTDLATAAADPAMSEALQGVQTALLDLETTQRSAATQVRARLTMDALSSMARYLAGIPGRKNLLWFSGSFPVSIQRDINTTGSPFAGNADMSKELGRTTALLARSQVAVYPIDARGLEAPPSMSPNENNFGGDIARTRRTYGTTSVTPRDDAFFMDQFGGRATMNELAEGTGGEAFYNTNALTAAAQKATADGENYYTLTYSPPPGAKPGDLRAVSVKVTRPGVKLAYRHSYTLDAINGDASTKGSDALSRSMSLSALNASEISLTIEPEKLHGAPPPKIIGIKAAGSTPTLYTLNFSVDVHDLNFTPGDDGKMHATLEFATVLYDGSGRVVDSQQDRAVLALDAARYASMLAGALRFHHNVALPVAGNQTVKMAVHDVTTSHVGSLQLTADQLRQAAAAKL